MRAMVFPVLIGLFGVSILVSLGNWQVNRLAEKEAFLADIRAMIGADSVALPEAPQEERDKFRAVRVSGQVVGEPLFVLTSQRGFGPGFRVIAAVETTSGLIAVDFGFLRGSQRDPALPAGQIEIEGNLHWPREQDSYTPTPALEKRLIYARDGENLSKALGTKPR